MAIQLAAIVPLVLGFIGWVNSLPDWVKYFVFLLGLAGDSTFTGGFTGGQGIVGSLISGFFQWVLHMPDFTIGSWQLLVIAAFAPIIFYLLQSQSR